MNYFFLDFSIIVADSPSRTHSGQSLAFAQAFEQAAQAQDLAAAFEAALVIAKAAEKASDAWAYQLLVKMFVQIRE